MKKVLYSIGAGLVIGAATATVVYLLSNKKKKECEVHYDYKEPDDEKTPVGNESLTEVSPAEDDPAYEEVKSSAIGKMYSRHEGAATIMRDSVETIRENVKVSESTNNEIDEVSIELDKMLSED